MRLERRRGGGGGGGCARRRRRTRRERGAMVLCAAAGKKNKTCGIKVCGVTNEEDAAVAAEAGATFVGIIFAEVSRRCVHDVAMARAIAAAARQGGAEPVGVFVEQGAADIERICESADIGIAQLHGNDARRALRDLPHALRAIWVLSAEATGEIVTPLPKEFFSEMEENNAAADISSTASISSSSSPSPPSRLASSSSSERTAMQTSTSSRSSSTTAPLARPQSVLTSAFDWQAGARRTIDYVLVDGITPGSGESFDWRALRVPRGCSRKGWLLAGGLDPSNVADAIRAVEPDVVDVASGVAGDDGVRKDAEKIRQFCDAVRSVTL